MKTIKGADRLHDLLQGYRAADQYVPLFLHMLNAGFLMMHLIYIYIYIYLCIQQSLKNCGHM